MKTVASAVVEQVMTALALGMLISSSAFAGVSYSRVAFHIEEGVELRRQLHATGGEGKLIIEETTEILASRKNGQIAENRTLVVEGDDSDRLTSKLSAMVLDLGVESTPPEEAYEVAKRGGAEFVVSADREGDVVTVSSSLPARDAKLGKLNVDIERAIRDVFRENESLVVTVREGTESDEAIPQKVSLRELTAAPEKFAGKRVELTGFLVLELERDALYETKKGALGQQRGPSVWIETENDRTLGHGLEKLKNRYVRLVGVFTTLDKGHFALWCGSLVRLTDASPVEGR